MLEVAQTAAEEFERLSIESCVRQEGRRNLIRASERLSNRVADLLSELRDVDEFFAEAAVVRQDRQRGMTMHG